MKQLHWIIFIFLFGVLAFLFIDTLDYTFTYREQDHLFLFDSIFFDKFKYKIGGIGEYIEIFIIQFFYMPYVGELILALILSSIYLLITLISRKISKVSDPLFIALVPAIYLLIQYESISFDLFHSTNLIIVLLFFYALSYLKKLKLIVITTLVIALLSYFLGWLYVIAAVIIIGLSATSAHLFKTLKWVHKWFFASIVILIYISVASILFIKNYNYRSKLVAITEISIQNRDWEKALKHTQRYSSKSQLMRYYQNIALANSGKLTTDLFKHRQDVGASSLFYLLDLNAAQYSKIGHYVYEYIGHINEATHWVNESFVMSGATSSNLINLIKYNILLDKPEVAMRYIRRLEKALFYQDKVDMYKNLISNNEKPNIYISKENNLSTRFTNTKEFQLEIESVLKSNPHNDRATIYYLSYLLLNKELSKFVNELTIYYNNSKENNNSKGNKISKLYLEALLIYIQYGGKSSIEHLLTEEMKSQYSEYITLKERRKWKELEQKYSKTYWFYLERVSK